MCSDVVRIHTCGHAYDTRDAIQCSESSMVRDRHGASESDRQYWHPPDEQKYVIRKIEGSCYPCIDSKPEWQNARERNSYDLRSFPFPKKYVKILHKDGKEHRTDSGILIDLALHKLPDVWITLARTSEPSTRRRISAGFGARRRTWSHMRR